MFKYLGIFLVVSGLVFPNTLALAEEEETEVPAITSEVTTPEITEAGVFVNEDEGSATGYTVTFAYQSADAETVQIDLGATMVKQGTLLGSVPDESESYTPYEWDSNMFPIGYEGYIVDLEKIDNTDLWAVSVPLPHGVFQYNYLVDGEAANDPTNPWGENPNEDGGADGDCTIYVPLNEEKQPNAIDYSYLDTESVTEAGELTYVSYTDINGDSAPLGVYLPYGYDAEREEPYKVLYVSHGGGANEVNWFGCGRLNTEFDHLIQEGRVEPTIVVTMNNLTYNWDFDVIVNNLIENIIPYMEENYNVSTEASGRGFCGLSMGGMTTSNVLVKQPNAFGYFGIFSGSDGSLDYSSITFENEPATIMIGYGCYDYGYAGRTYNPESENPYTFNGITFAALGLAEADIDYSMEEVSGAHDWFTWSHLMQIFAEDYLWK